ncbi:MAG: DUF4349 domain-containing protein [Lachnospiraceae bacterium]|jgi:hypothetical protein|nr:DUF4349 domain-containing protein [Lachnospiraceae bacterium]
MKKRTKRTAVLAIAVLTVWCTGCGAASDKTMSETIATSPASRNDSYDIGGGDYKTENGGMTEESGELAEVTTENGDPGVQDGRKLIETVRLEVETKEFKETMAALETQAEELGGYIESMDTYNGSSYSEYGHNRNASLTIRIPSGKLDGFLQTVARAGSIVRRNDTVEDVTLSYVDMESRRDTLRTEQSRLLEFLDKAETIEEIITIEQRLSEVRYQLESMESRLRTMDNLIDYSTVYIEVSEVHELTPVETPTAWERITGGFAESLESIAHGGLELCIWFLVHIPYLVIWGILIAAAVILVKRRRRKKRERLEEQLRRSASAEIEKNK